MSLPNIPDIIPEIDVTTKEAANMLLSSVALEGIGLSHIINAEGEKSQYILSKLKCKAKDKDEDKCMCYIRESNKLLTNVLNSIIKSQIILQLKLENTVDILENVDTKDNCYDLKKNNENIDDFLEHEFGKEKYKEDCFGNLDLNENYEEDCFGNLDLKESNGNKYNEDCFGNIELNECSNEKGYYGECEVVECNPEYYE